MAHGSQLATDGMASRDLVLCLLLLALLYSTIGQTAPHIEHLPEFLAPLENHTVTQGRDIFFTCVVNHLQSYKVAWIKSDSRAILAIQTHMVAHNHRLSVTHNGHNTWKLHVLNVQPDDSGTYMCQVNTDPMRSLTGYMNVLIPPDIMDLDEANERPTITEHEEVILRCRATGTPKPVVTWRREDGRGIVLRTGNSRSLVVKSYKNEELHLTGILRQEMGSYLCIASNGVPPSVSKRYYVNVLFKPSIKIRDQLVVSPINGDVLLECFVESSPRALAGWYTENGMKVILDERHTLTEAVVNDYTYQVNLIIQRIRPSDFTMYTCFAENSFGTSNAVIRIREQIKVKSTSIPSRKKFLPNRLEKVRKTHNFNLNNGKSSSSIFKNVMTSLAINNNYNDGDDDVYSDSNASGAYYGSTDYPGQLYFNGAMYNKPTGNWIVNCIIAFTMFLLC